MGMLQKEVSTTERQYAFWMMCAIVFIVLASGIGLRDPHPADEPRFALVAHQMVSDGQWLFPHRGEELYSDKPPMLMWLQAITFSVLGSWKIAFLLPSLLAGFGIIACVYDSVRRFWTPQAARFTVYLLLFCFQFTYQLKRAQIDGVLLFFMTLANYGLLRHTISGPKWRWWCIGWFAAGLGTISKGVGALSLLMLIPAAIASIRNFQPSVRIGIHNPRFWLGPIAFIAAVSIWLLPVCIAVYRLHNPEYTAYLHDILFHQTVQRYAHPWGHEHGPLYFVGVICTMWLPASVFLPWALPAWGRLIRAKDSRYFIPAVWCIIVLVFFTLSPGKRDMYIMPALPMMCCIIGPLLCALFAQRSVRVTLCVLQLVLLASLLILSIGMLWFPQSILIQLQEYIPLDTVNRIGFAFLLTCLFGALCFCILRNSQYPIPGIVMLTCVWVVIGVLVYPAINDEISARGLMRTVGSVIGPNAQLGLVSWKEQELLMADRPAQTFGFSQPGDVQLQRAIAWQMQDPAKRWLLVQQPAVLECIDRKKSIPMGVANHRYWWLVPSRAVHGPCQTPASRTPDTLLE